MKDIYIDRDTTQEEADNIVFSKRGEYKFIELLHSTVRLEIPEYVNCRNLNIFGCPNITEVPRCNFQRLDVSNRLGTNGIKKLPDWIDCEIVNIDGMDEMPKTLKAEQFKVEESKMRTFNVKGRFDDLSIQHCPRLKSIGPNTSARHIGVMWCPRLTDISPNVVGISLYFVEVGIYDLNFLNPRGKYSYVVLHDCPNITEIPEWLNCNELNVENCPNIETIPDSVIKRCKKVKFIVDDEPVFIK